MCGVRKCQINTSTTNQPTQKKNNNNNQPTIQPTTNGFDTKEEKKTLSLSLSSSHNKQNGIILGFSYIHIK
jgi:hypothetical protein